MYLWWASLTISHCCLDISILRDTYQTMDPNGTMVETTDVLIIGAGPAGLMCANALGELGVQTIIVDRR